MAFHTARSTDMTKSLAILILGSLMLVSITGQAQDGNGEDSSVEATLDIDEDSITDEDIRDYLRKREEYQDDPATLKMMDQIQEAAGITEADIARARGETPPAESPETGQQEPAIEADADAAEQAYRDGDYETARQHYEALAAEGNGYANLMLGLMYHQGQGVDTDMSKAHAYYDRAEDYGEERGRELNETIKHEMSSEAMQRARENYSAIVEKQQKEGAPVPEQDEQREQYPAVIIENGRPAAP